jgi:hypothetical protein
VFADLAGSGVLGLWERVRAAGGELASVAEGATAATPPGELASAALAAQSVAEAGRRRERLDSVRQAAVQAGVWQARRPPRGYARDPRTRALVPDGHADEVRALFLMRAAGVPVSDLARQVGMTSAGIRHLLSNRAYLGELRVGPHLNPVAHEPLVDPATWERVQRPRARPPRAAAQPALLAGLARCAGCGRRLSRGGSARRPVYACPGRAAVPACPAPAAVAVHLLDPHVRRIAAAQAEPGERPPPLRELVGAVLVRRAGGRGARVPLAERVRVMRADAGLEPGEPPPWPAADAPGVLAPAGG